jgi:predicted acyl esterase
MIAAALVVWAQLASLTSMDDRTAERYIRTMPADSFRKYSAIIHEDDERRYIIDRDVPIPTTDGASACAALVVRPRRAAGKLPALLQFSIYHPLMSEARRSASHGYVGVEAEPRGKQCGAGAPVPYEHDGTDAVAVIDWIAAQPWSDGRVGMYGGSYNGGAQWAAAKHRPQALKAIMPQAPVAPGIDVPMEGNVFWMFVYPWTFYTTDGKDNDNAVYSDTGRWHRLDHDWYVSGRAFRDHDKIDGTPNPFYDRWLDHPSYDAYWQELIPYREEFSAVNIPVLQTAGYFYGGPGAALYYFMQHHQYSPHAEHYLVIGPYDHYRAQSGPDTSVISNYHLDPVAMVDLRELRYQWFDYVFRGAPKPALLEDAVNYEVMGANTWKHAPTVAAMADGHRRIHLTATTQTIDLTDRSDVDRVAPGNNIVDTVIDTWNGVKTVGEPFTEPTEVSGLFSGSLDFITNKKDFDFQVQLYELTPKGDYVMLAPYWSRASYVADLSQRRLLTPGKRQRLSFTSGRLMSRLCQAGSRIVIVLNIIKNPGQQINYGTGRDVSDETVADGTEPLRIQWFGDSFIDVPVSPAHSRAAPTASRERASR